MKNFLLGSMATLGLLGLAVGGTLGVWAAVGEAPWEKESSVEANPEPTAAGVSSPTPSVFANMDSEEKQKECDAIEWFFSEEGFGGIDTVLGRLVDPVEWTLRWLPAARECFSESKIHGLVRVPAEFWLTSQSNVPAELHPQLLEPTMSWLAGETPVERTEALNEMAAFIRLYYVSHPAAQIVFTVPSAPSAVPGRLTSQELRLHDLEREISRLNFDIRGLR